MRTFILICLSFLIAIFLTMLPLPHWAIWLRPKWVVLVSIYWGFMLPSRYGVGFAWLLGLFLDMLLGTLLGAQAFALAFITYLAVKFNVQLRLFVGGKRMLVVFFLVFLYQTFLYVIQALLQKMPFLWQFWLPAVTSALFWPWIYFLLKACQRRFHVSDPVARGFVYGRE